MEIKNIFALPVSSDLHTNTGHNTVHSHCLTVRTGRALSIRMVIYFSLVQLQNRTLLFACLAFCCSSLRLRILSSLLSLLSLSLFFFLLRVIKMLHLIFHFSFCFCAASFHFVALSAFSYLFQIHHCCCLHQPINTFCTLSVCPPSICFPLVTKKNFSAQIIPENKLYNTKNKY